MKPASKPRAFASAAALRAWLAKQPDETGELWLRLFRAGSGKRSVTYAEAVEEALCVGWIDGLRKRADDESYLQRFTPRKPGSYWSTINIRKAEALLAAGRMRPAGLAAFEARHASAARRESFENRPHDLPADALGALRKHPGALAAWREQPVSYRRAVAWWIVSAVRPETRARRIARLADHARRGERVPQFVSPAKRTPRNAGAGANPSRRDGGPPRRASANGQRRAPRR